MRDLAAGTLRRVSTVASGPASPVGAVSVSIDAAGDRVAYTAPNGKALVTATNGADDYPIAIIRASATSFTALSMKCTHEACEVNAPQGTSITCSCHGSRFDLSGNVLNGPANSPLYKYVTTYDASARTVTVKSV